MRKSYSFALAGGMDEESQPLVLNPGQLIACLNHEVLGSGYARIDGFERFDGQTGPTDFPFFLINFAEGATQFAAGDVVVGATSGANGIVLVDAELSSGAWDGTGVGMIGLRSVTGTFQGGEDLLVSGTPYASAVGSAVQGAAGSGDEVEDAIAKAARDYARALISAVPGSGPVRGVWEFEGTVYAFRDSVDAMSGRMFKSSASGWQAVTLGHQVDFTSGGVTPIVDGDTITGATSGATAQVARVIVQSGSWAGGNATGYLVLSGITGTFAAENLDVGASTNLATIAAAPEAITLPPGGRYFFHSHNFYGASNRRRVYGCNGVGTGFEFNASMFVPIRTGMAVDTPNRVSVFRNQLFFAFPGGSSQHSAPGEPISWEAVLGALEIGVGSDVADYIVTADALLILAEHGIFALTGTTVDDWVLSPITLEAGAIPFTAQRFGPGVYLDNRGLRSISATQAYGNFSMGTMSRAVKKTLKRKQDNSVKPIASTIVRSKSHYRLFFDDGSGFSFYMGRKFPEPSYFDLGKVVRCVSSNESQDDNERIFFGSDDGFVYQMDKGTSFDGEAIEAFAQLPYANMGSPNVLKRVHRCSLEMAADTSASIGVTLEYDYSNNEQADSSSSTVTMAGLGGLWNVAFWDEFYWSSPVENVLDVFPDGQGRNVSTIIYSNSEATAPYVMRGVTFYFGERGAIR